MCNECGKVCWQAPPMTEEELFELETHIAELMRVSKESWTYEMKEKYGEMY